MPQMRSQIAGVRRFMTLILATFFVTGLGFGQSLEAVRFNVPYRFSAGSKQFPAGTYTFSLLAGPFSMLKVQSESIGPVNVNVLTRISGPSELFTNSYLIFDKAPGHLILSEVWIPGTDGILVRPIPKNDGRLALSGSDINPNKTYTGKETYSLTCAKCHGKDGNGEVAADKFFKVKIPRLTSTTVQSMSDAELKKQIMQGDILMPPVEVDEAGFRHRLPPRDVDAVVAYLRTLKP
jgi:Cytochrome C oxidase, cbb3-type, subunit III